MCKNFQKKFFWLNKSEMFQNIFFKLKILKKKILKNLHLENLKVWAKKILKMRVLINVTKETMFS